MNLYLNKQSYCNFCLYKQTKIKVKDFKNDLKLPCIYGVLNELGKKSEGAMNLNKKGLMNYKLSTLKSQPLLLVGDEIYIYI